MREPQEKKELFSFKQKSFDFIVEEQLPFLLDGKGDALYVFFEKQNMTTMDVLDRLCKWLKISRMTLGIAGLKDKDAITRQRISIYSSALDIMGGEHVFIDMLSRFTRVIKSNWHARPLQMTDHIENKFFIRLRAISKLGLKDRADSESIVNKIFSTGFPNFYGTQRFGINGKNRELGKAFLEGKMIRDPFERKFKLQAYASRLFNQYLKERLPLGFTEPLDGELLMTKEGPWIYQKETKEVILQEKSRWGTVFFFVPKQTSTKIPFAADMQIVAPVWWFNTPLSDPQTEAGLFQRTFMSTHKITEKVFAPYKEAKIFGILRPIWVNVKLGKVRFQEDDLLIEFTLGSGSYASILIHQLFQSLSVKE